MKHTHLLPLALWPSGKPKASSSIRLGVQGLGLFRAATERLGAVILATLNDPDDPRI